MFALKQFRYIEGALEGGYHLKECSVVFQKIYLFAFQLSDTTTERLTSWWYSVPFFFFFCFWKYSCKLICILSPDRFNSDQIKYQLPVSLTATFFAWCRWALDKSFSGYGKLWGWLSFLYAYDQWFDCFWIDYDVNPRQDVDSDT